MTKPTLTVRKYKLGGLIMGLVEDKEGKLTGPALTLAWASIHSMLEGEHYEETTPTDKAHAVCAILAVAREIYYGRPWQK